MTDRITDPARLEALERSGLLLKPPTECMTHVCYSAVELLKADVAQINVLDERLQHHIAEWPRVPPREDIDVESSGCREVIVSEEVVAVSNTLEHPVLCQLPWTATWQGYLGAPLFYEGQVVGSLCVLTVGPREWTRIDQMTVSALAGLAESCMQEA